MHWIDWLLFSSILLLFFFVGVIRVYVKKEKKYLLNNKQTGLFSLISTLVMTELNPSSLIAFSSMGYIVGYWGLWMPFILLAGIFFYGITVAKQWKKFDGMSISEFFEKKYGKNIARFVSISLLTAMLGFSATYVKSMSLIFEPFFPKIPSLALSTIFIILILSMCIKGGLFSIIRLDNISFVMTILFFPILFGIAFFLTKDTSIPEVFQISKARINLPFSFVFSLIILCMFTYILAPWYGQKIFSAKDSKTAKKATIISSLCVFLIYALAVLSASFLRLYDSNLENAEKALPKAIATLLPMGLKGIGFALLFGAGATTLSGVWSAMTNLVVVDFFEKKEQRSFVLSGMLMLFFAFCSLALAFIFVDKVFPKLILFNIPVFALSFALLAGFYWRGVTKIGAFLSIIVGLFWGSFSYIYFGEAEYTWYWAIYGFFMIFSTGVFGSLVSSKISKTDTLKT